jgi:hypothetical protein
MPRAASRARSALSRGLFGRDPIRRSIYLIGMLPAVWTFYLGLNERSGCGPFVS